MVEKYQVKFMVEKIETLRRTATELKQISGGIQAIDRNADRILASVKMMEINISDVADIITEEQIGR